MIQSIVAKDTVHNYYLYLFDRIGALSNRLSTIRSLFDQFYFSQLAASTKSVHC